LAQFRNTADIMDLVLRNAGELTDGTSSYEAQTLDALNQVHQTIINGGNEFDTDIDEVWNWAKARHPIILELLPALETGTVSLTQGSELGTFSSAPTDSQAGHFLKITNRATYYRIASHVAGATAFDLDATYADDTGATLSFQSIKLDYDLVAPYIIIDDENDKIDFEETVATELTATLTKGSYLPADLATEVDTQLTAAGASAFTVTFSADTRKFTLTSDLAGGGSTFKLLGATGTNAGRSALIPLGYDHEDRATAATHVSVYVLSSIVRFIEPLTVFRANTSTRTQLGGSGDLGGNIFSVDEITFQKDYPLVSLVEGVPLRFTIVREKPDGTITIRFSSYPREKTRVEVPHIEVPRDLKDNVASVPLIPRKFVQILEYGATFYILLQKNDTKAQSYASLAKEKLAAMMKQNQKELMRSGKNFGTVIPRRDNVFRVRGRLIFGVPD